MSWWKNDEKDLPEELRGKTPEEIAAALKAGKAAEASQAELERLRTESTTKDNELAETKRKLNEIEANSRRQPANPIETPSVLLDEDGAFRERLKPTNAVALHAGSLAARMSAYQTLKGKDRYIWDKYSAEIDQFMQKENADRRIFPEIWLNCLTYVKGIHTDDITKSDFFAELGSSTEPGSQPRGEARKTDLDKLSDEEKVICKRMKISEEEYITQKKAMAGQNQDAVWSPSNHPGA